MGESVLCMCPDSALSSSNTLYRLGYDASISISLSIADVPPGTYNIIINVTDIYGQTAGMVFALSVSGRSRYIIYSYYDRYCLSTKFKNMVYSPPPPPPISPYAVIIRMLSTNSKWTL